MEKLVLCGRNNATYHARGYEFPVIIPPLPNSDSYGATVFKHNMTDTVTESYFSNFVPNPTNGKTTLKYQLSDDQAVNLQIFDMNGQVVVSTRLVGSNEYSLDNNNLHGGLYMYVISNDQNVLVRNKLVVIK